MCEMLVWSPSLIPPTPLLSPNPGREKGGSCAAAAKRLPLPSPSGWTPKARDRLPLPSPEMLVESRDRLPLPSPRIGRRKGVGGMDEGENLARHQQSEHHPCES
jgi:hypothetical protein